MMKQYEGALTGAQSNSVLLQIDSETYKGDTLCAVAIQVLSVGTSAVLNFEQSNDGTNWRPCGAWAADNTSAGLVTSANAVGMYVSQWFSRFFRVRITGKTTGTSSVVLIASDMEAAPQNTNVSGSVFAIQRVDSGAPGSNTSRVKSAATTNATSLKTTAGNLFGVNVANTSAAAKYLKFYNKTSAPVVGTDTPLVTLPIPAGGRVDITFGPAGLRFSAGIAYAITGALADNDATAVAVDDVTGVLNWA